MDGRIMQRFVQALALAIVALPSATQAQVPDTILYGVAYYDEYTPVDRVDEDARMMKAAGISVVRIAESTCPGSSISAMSTACLPRCTSRASR
jgi:beta-galactosidase